MKPTQTRHDLPASHPLNIVGQLIRQPETQTDIALDPVTERCVAMLDRRAPETVRTARDAGVEIEHLGISPLFDEARFYEGIDTDWVLAPADRLDDAIVPGPEGRDLRRLVGAGVEFPLIYIAHEVEQAQTKELREAAAEGRRELTSAQAAKLVGPVPPPADSVALGDRLAHRSTQVARATRRTAQLAGAAALGAVAVPVALVGGALGALATMDPIVIGAMPATREKPGDPASWFVLARWDW